MSGDRISDINDPRFQAVVAAIVRDSKDWREALKTIDACARGVFKIRVVSKP